MIRTKILGAMAATALLSATGCGAAGAPAAGGATTSTHEAAQPQVVQPSVADQQVIADYEPDITSLDAELMSQLQLSTGPDCDLARDLRDRICDLADRICDIAGRHPDRGDVVDKCEDGRGRCDRARERVAESCPEE